MSLTSGRLHGRGRPLNLSFPRPHLLREEGPDSQGCCERKWAMHKVESVSRSVMSYSLWPHGCESWTVKKAERWRTDAF